MMATFLHFKSNALSAYSMRREDVTLATATWLCSDCNWVLPGNGAVDLTLRENQIRSPMLNGVMGTGLALVHDDFLEIFRQSTLDSFLSLGKVYASSGRLIQHWHTVNPRIKFILRGESNVAHRVCATCHRNIYYAAGKAYLVEPYPPESGIFGTDLFGILAPRTELTITTPKLRGVEILEVPLVQEALDGLQSLEFYSQSFQPE